jgi:hypothetical protein
MKKLYFLFFILLITASLSAQKDHSSRWGEPGISERTWPVDSCLYFQLPMNFLITKVQPAPGGNDLITMKFRSSDPSGPFFEGKGRSLLDSLFAPTPNWEWLAGQKGKGVIVLPDAAFGIGPGADNFMLPMPANGFYLEIDGIIIEPPYPIIIQVQDFTTED